MNERVRNYLIQAARSRKFVTYSQVNRDCDLRLDFDYQTGRNEIGRILGEIGAYEYRNNRPILSAVVVHEGSNDHGKGFYNLCEELKIGDARRLQRDHYGMAVMRECFDYWSQQ